MSTSRKARAAATATSELESADKEVSPALVANFLNSFYKNFTSNKSASQRLLFKSFPTEELPEGSNVIDIASYQGLFDFIQTYKTAKFSIRKDDKDEKSARARHMSETIDKVFDLRLRACLDIANRYRTNDPSKLNPFKEFVLPQLDFTATKSNELVDYIKAINNFFDNDSRLKMKLFNIIFPHPTHKDNELPKGVNVVYLQHMSRFHDEILEFVIEQELEDKAVLEEVRGMFNSAFKLKDKVLSKEEFLSNEVAVQLLNPKIIETVLNPPVVTVQRKSDKEPHQQIDPKWIDSLKAISFDKSNKKNPIVESDQPLSAEQKHAVLSLARELFLAKNFIKIIHGSINARRLIKVMEKQVGEDGLEREVEVEASEPMDVDLHAFFEKYKSAYRDAKVFRKKWQSIIASELGKIDKVRATKPAPKVESTEESSEDKDTKTKTKSKNKDVPLTPSEEADRLTYELFLKYLIDTSKFLKNKLNYTTPLRSFLMDIKHDVVLRFNKAVREFLAKTIDGDAAVDATELSALTLKNFRDWKYVSYSRAYDPEDLHIYSRIGRFGGLNLKKEFRVAMGISMVAFIQDNIKRIRAANAKKRDIVVYIKL